MNHRQAVKIFNDISDLATQLGNKAIDNALPTLYDEMEHTKSSDEIYELLSELMFFVDEAEDFEDLKSEIQTLFNKMQDELE